MIIFSKLIYVHVIRLNAYNNYDGYIKHRPV